MMSIADPMAINVETPRIDSGALWRKSSLNLFVWIPGWYYIKLPIRLIHVTVVYVVLWLETLKTSCGWMIVFWLWLMNPLPRDLQNIIDFIWHEVLKHDWVVKMGSLALGIRGDRLNEWYVVKYLAKVIKILDKLFLMNYYTHHY